MNKIIKSFSSVTSFFELLKTAGLLTFYFVVAVGALMLFGATIKYRMELNASVSQVVYFLVQSGFYIVLGFLFFIFALSPLGNLLYTLLFRLTILYRHTVSKNKVIVDKSVMYTLLKDDNLKTLLMNDDNEVLIDCYIQKKTTDANNVLLRNFTTENLFTQLFASIVLFLISYYPLKLLYSGNTFELIYAYFCLAITIPVIKIAILKYKENIKFSVVLAGSAIMYPFLIAGLGYNLFDNYMKLTGHITESIHKLALNKSCMISNLPSINKYKSEIQILTESEIKSNFFNESSNIYLSRYVESYSVLSFVGSFPTFVNIYDNKSLYLPKHKVSIDLSDCYTAKVLN